MAEELKPCPFCGAKATGAHQAGSAFFIDVDHEPTCFLADFQRTEAEAIAAWNALHLTEGAEIVERLEALEAAAWTWGHGCSDDNIPDRTVEGDSWNEGHRDETRRAREALASLISGALFDTETLRKSRDRTRAALEAMREERTTQEAELTRLRQRVAELEGALREVEEVLVLVEHPAFPDPDYQTAVEELGTRIGFGALMTAASAGWRKSSIVKGGEFVAGPCFKTIIRTLALVRQVLNHQPNGDE